MIRCQDNDNISSQKYKEFTYYASNFGGIMFFILLRALFQVLSGLKFKFDV